MNDIINGLKYFGNQILEFIKKHIVIIIIVMIIVGIIGYLYIKFFGAVESTEVQNIEPPVVQEDLPVE